VCNECAQLSQTLDMLGQMCRTMLVGGELDGALRLLVELRLHVFRGVLEHSSSRDSVCATHNPAFVLGEPLPPGVKCAKTCIACRALAAIGRRLIVLVAASRTK
jgi:hypothetical protein